MTRLRIERSRVAPRVTLNPEEKRYLVTVLRLAAGDALEVFDGEGGRYEAKLLDSDTLEVGARSEAPAGRRVVLAQALAKGDKLDLVVQKATELGASAVAPFSAERCVVKLEGARAEDRVKRWQRIAEEASRQCERDDVPEVLPITSFAALLERAKQEGARIVVLYERERSLRLSQALAQLDGPLWLCVGPEGGFADAEIDAARASGAFLAGLGERILRTETAGLAALCVVRFLAGELG